MNRRKFFGTLVGLVVASKAPTTAPQFVEDKVTGFGCVSATI